MSSPSTHKAHFTDGTDDKPVVIAIDDASKTTEIILLDEATNKRLLRKIDWKLMPVVR